MTEMSGPEPCVDAEVLEGVRCANRYLIGEAIAVGGMSVVYRGRDERSGEPVAVKVLHRSLAGDSGLVALFLREADNGWSLRHRGFVKFLAQGWVGGRPFVILEFLEGQHLGAAMRAEFATGAPWPIARRLLRKIGAALAHAHSRGLVHADLKPGNIFLLTDGEPRILDLGAAQVIHHGSSLDADCEGGYPVGAITPAYASAEMLLGAPADPRDDVFSLAVIGYELVTGRHPFDRNPADRAHRLDLRPERPRAMPGHAWRALRRGLALRRNRRPAAMATFVAGLCFPFPAEIVAAGALALTTALMSSRN